MTIVRLMKKARDSARASRMLLNGGSIDDAVSRAYYAMFNTARALIMYREPAFVSGTHGPVLSKFSLPFVKTQELPKDWGAAINRAQNARHVADYDEEAVEVREAEEHVRRAYDLFQFKVRVIPPDELPDDVELDFQADAALGRIDAELHVREQAAFEALARTIVLVARQRDEATFLGLYDHLILNGDPEAPEAVLQGMIETERSLDSILDDNGLSIPIVESSESLSISR